MKHCYARVILVGALCAISHLSPAQTTNDVRALVREGVELYDEGHLDEAVAKYQQALKLDPNSTLAKAELAMTYNALGRNNEAVQLCQQILATDKKLAPSVYGTYGNALDALKQPKEAVKVYQQGIKQFPDDGLLHFNLGIAYYGQRQRDEATQAFQRAVQLTPRHASSHMYLGLLTAETGNRVPAILELTRFLVLEPQGRRATACMPQLDQLMQAGAEKTGDNSVTLNISQLTLDGAKKGKGTDNFAQTEMLLSMMSALDYDDKNKDKTPSARMAEKLDDLIGNLAEQGSGSHKGFVWEYYVPYFLEMKRKDFVPACTYLIRSAHTDQPDVQQWLAAHTSEVEAFREWSKNYAWPK